MKHTLTVTLLTLTLCSQAWSQDATNEAKEPDKKEVSAGVKMWQNFSNLPKETREEYSTMFRKAQNLFNQKRIFDTLETLDILQQIFPDHPAELNLRGACYVEIRSFDKASVIFNKILKVAPENTNVLFNLAELDFVTNKWASSHARFESLIPKIPKGQKAMLRLCEFKFLLCKLKLDKVDEAQALAEKYDQWDDSPFYYYSQGALLYHADSKQEADKMFRNARYVWRNSAVLAPWQDTLIEFGYIRSFYGNSEEEE